ncbi:MAG: type II/IV secretion system ATPase subunit [Thermoplasmatota archaeon]
MSPTKKPNPKRSQPDARAAARDALAEGAMLNAAAPPPERFPLEPHPPIIEGLEGDPHPLRLGGELPGGAAPAPGGMGPIGSLADPPAGGLMADAGSSPPRPDAPAKPATPAVPASPKERPSAPPPARPERPAARPDGAARVPDQADARAPTKAVEAQSIQVDKAAGKAGVAAMEGQRSQSAIAQQVARRSVRAETLRLPEFPPPAAERPEPLKLEERRRVWIREKEEARRGRLRAANSGSDLARLEEEWSLEDKLHYRTDPDDRELEVYAIKEPFAYVQMILNEATHEKLYHVIEPRLDRDEALVLQFIESTLVDVLDLQPEELEKSTIEDYIVKKFDDVIADYSILLQDPPTAEEKEREKGLAPEERRKASQGRRDAARSRLLYYVLRDFIGEGPIDAFMRDPMIEDISCDGPHQPVFIYHRKYEPLTTTVRFRDHDQLDSFVIRMAQRAGKHVSIADPILDATMRDGSRLQATLAKEVSSFGSTFTIRKFREIPFTPIDLVRFGTMAARMLAYLWMVIQYHQSAIYAGGTASGKTTAINAIMCFIPPNNKVVTIEDTREINIPQPNWIAGITRGGFGPRDEKGRQAGEIDMFQLLKNALRQRPEYIIVGEVRGAEAYNLFQAMATGHAAYGTMHADSVDAVIHRLESDPINIPRSLLEALDVVSVQVQTRVGGKRVRRTKQITEIVGLDPNTREILTNEVFHWEPSTDKFVFSGVSYSLERIAAEAGLTSEQVMKELDDRTRAIEWMVRQGISEYRAVASIIHTYYHDRAKVMEHAQGDLPWVMAPVPEPPAPPPPPEPVEDAKEQRKREKKEKKEKKKDKAQKKGEKDGS